MPGHDGRENMPDQVLIYSRFPKAMMVRIGQRFELMDAAGKPPREVFTADQLSGIRAMITAGGTPLGAAMMDTLPSLRAIVCYGTGYDGVDLAAAAQLGIAVGHSPAANASAVAALAVTPILAVTRPLLPADEYGRSPHRQDHRRRRSRCVRERAACAGCADRVSECRADPAYRRPHPGLASGDAGLRDRQSRGVFCRQAPGLCGEVSRVVRLNRS